MKTFVLLLLVGACLAGVADENETSGLTLHRSMDNREWLSEKIGSSSNTSKLVTEKIHLTDATTIQRPDFKRKTHVDASGNPKHSLSKATRGIRPILRHNPRSVRHGSKKNGVDKRDLDYYGYHDDIGAFYPDYYNGVYYDYYQDDYYYGYNYDDYYYGYNYDDYYYGYNYDDYYYGYNYDDYYYGYNYDDYYYGSNYDDSYYGYNYDDYYYGYNYDDYY